MRMVIWSREEKRVVYSPSELMALAGLDPSSKYEAVGVQDDGTPVVFNKCGGFGYLDPNLYRLLIDLTEVD